MSIRGFILQPTYRVEAGRAVVRLHGVLDNGATFLVRDDRDRPAFYIAEKDLERAHALGARGEPSDLRTLDGLPAARVPLRLPSDTPELRDRLHAAGLSTYEADLRFPVRFLIARGLRASLAIDGKWRPGKGIDRVYDNPRLAAAEWVPRLRVLSFDIETDPKARRLLSIALHGCGAAEVLLFSPRDLSVPPGAIGFSKERDLLAAFCRRVKELDPDVLTGWNVVDFDLYVLEKMARRYRIPFDLARGTGVTRVRPSRGPWNRHEATVPGRLVLDGIHLLRGAFIKMDRYGLDHVAREVLGHGKTFSGGDRAKEIVEAFLRHRERFVEYNLTDARLVSEILQKLGLVELAVQRSRLTGLAPDRVAGSIAAFDFLYLSALGKLGVVAPSVGQGRGGSTGEVNLGGHVLEPEPGLYRNVLVLDFKSLYPSLIRTFQIDPLGFLPVPKPSENAIVAPNGAAFRRQPGLLTHLLDELFPRREEAKAAGDAVKSHAIKILMNSFYGVLGTTACRFYRPQLAGAITSFGRELLLWSKARFEAYGQRVLYGDTDSLFVAAGVADPAQAMALGEDLVRRLNADLSEHIRRRWGCTSRLDLELEKLYRRLVLLPARGSFSGARKRYVGLVGEGEEAEVIFTGMEVVRRDWTDLAKTVQRELYARLFSDRPVDSYLKAVVAELREGKLDAALVYRKGLRKPLAEYTATTPPHVAAARKLAAKPGRLIEYLITREGPEPLSESNSPIDHEHYVQKQVRPVAEPVLAILGQEFDRVIGDNVQLELF